MLQEQNSETQEQINYQASFILRSYLFVLSVVTSFRKKLEKTFFMVVLSDKLGEKKFLHMEFVWQRVNGKSYKNVFQDE